MQAAVTTGETMTENVNRIVWGRATSSNVMKVLWGLGELGLPFERIDVGGAFGKTDTPEYRAMNPTGLVPTLQEGDFPLWESNAIVRYLGQVHASGSTLWPAATASNKGTGLVVIVTLVRPLVWRTWTRSIQACTIVSHEPPARPALGDISGLAMGGAG